MKKPKTKKYTGVLDGWFETGSEGTYWVLDTQNPKADFYGLIFIEPGDHLKVFNEDGSVAFEGEIIPDFKTGWKQYPGNPDPKMGQQAVFSCDWYVHWIQKGWKPDDWAKLFIWHFFEQGRGVPQHRAELIKKAKKDRPK